MTTTPSTQHAVQLIGPGQLKLNPSKPVFKPGPHQILAKIECVGLCFSDLKLLKQFDQHPRKSSVVSGVDQAVLAEVPNYVPGDKPTVPGHEVTCRIVAVGNKVTKHKVGERCLVQTDWRELPTAGSNAAFGYNFEGALQEYALFDERIIVESDGERLLIPVPENLPASAIALVEPWACVEDSYVTHERQHIKDGGKLAVVVAPGGHITGVQELLAAHQPALITIVAEADLTRAVDRAGIPVSLIDDAAKLADEGFDDIIYFGADQATIEVLNDKLAAKGIINIVLGGKKIGQEVNIGVGRLHYGMTRWVGTTGSDPAESYKMIPATGEVRPNDKVVIIGAGGPMGQMHVIRTVCSGVEGISVTGTDRSDSRLAAIEKKARPLAQANHVPLHMVNTATTPLKDKFSYTALMAPVGALLAEAVRDSLPDAIVNIFAGIPAPTKHHIDLDLLIANRTFLFGTSGSVIRDMKIVLEKVKSSQLDTNKSVDAISGMKGAIDGIKAVEERTLAGKIIVYPMLHDMGLIPLHELASHYPTVAAKLHDEQWTKEAEEELLKVAAK